MLWVLYTSLDFPQNGTPFCVSGFAIILVMWPRLLQRVVAKKDVTHGRYAYDRKRATRCSNA